jgi:peptidoglycan/LPS O-acetylase OafA/YrhL
VKYSNGLHKTLLAELMSFESYRARKRFEELDGLRAIAVLMVVTVHMHDMVLRVLNGGLGVVIFYVLSGYLITMLALREEEARGRLDFISFYIRRTFRIFPLYYVVLATYAFLILVLKDSIEKSGRFVHALPYYVLYLQEIPYFRHSFRMPFYQCWSLGVEEKFYLFWPLIFFGVLALAKELRGIVTGVLIVLLCFSPVFPTAIRWYQLEHFAYILMGALLALILEEPSGFALMQRLGTPGVVVTMGLILPLQLTRLQATPRATARTVYAVVFMVFLGGLVSNEGPIQRLLSNRLIGFVGELSYGIYLVQLLCINIAEKVFPPHKGLVIPAYVLTCLISILVAFILNRTVERPMIRIGRLLRPRIKAESRVFDGQFVGQD